MINYRKNDYFNDKDYFLFFDEGLNKYFTDKLHFFHGNWFCNHYLKYKMTSIKSINCNELNE